VTVHRVDSNTDVAALFVIIGVQRDNLTTVPALSGYSTVIASCVEYAVLTPGSSYTAEFVWNETAPMAFDPVTNKYLYGGDGLPGPTGYEMSGIVYVVSGVAFDEDVANNIDVDGTVTVLVLVADINNDGTSNILDIATAATAFGSYPGHDRWDHTADINEDDEVNILDIAGIAIHFGETLESLAAS